MQAEPRAHRAVATPCWPAPVSATMRFFPSQRASRPGRRVVELVRAGVRQVLALEVDAPAERESLRERERRRTPRIASLASRPSCNSRRKAIATSTLTPGGASVRRAPEDERLRDESPAELAEDPTSYSTPPGTVPRPQRPHHSSPAHARSTHSFNHPTRSTVSIAARDVDQRRATQASSDSVRRGKAWRRGTPGRQPATG